VHQRLFHKFSTWTKIQSLNHYLQNEIGDCMQESRREDRGGSLRRLGRWSVIGGRPVGGRLDGCSSSGAAPWPTQIRRSPGGAAMARADYGGRRRPGPVGWPDRQRARGHRTLGARSLPCTAGSLPPSARWIKWESSQTFFTEFIYRKNIKIYSTKSILLDTLQIIFHNLFI